MKSQQGFAFVTLNKAYTQFSRWLSEHKRRLLYKELKHCIRIKLATEMTKTFTTGDESNIDAGLTYIGQMISHDIVPATTMNPRSRKNVEPYLNLSSIFGSDPDRNVSFVLKELRHNRSNRKGYDIERYDFIIDSKKERRANIPEPRNDENVIISQLHALWQRLFNLLLVQEAQSLHSAQHLTIKAFQLIVIEDFLYHILDEQVFKALFENKHVYFHPELKQDVIPDYFKHAAFRFGHSMIRDFYRIQSSPVPDLPLKKLFNGNQDLQTSQVIDWRKMFANPSQQALLIDTHITPIMQEVKFSTASPIDINVVMKNLEAGMKNKLRSGTQELALLNKHNASNPLFNGIGQFPPLELEQRFLDCGFEDISELPLWPYILLEAEQNKGRSNRLGKLGSLLVGEVIKNAIENAPVSVFSQGKYNFEDTIQTMGQLGQDLNTNASPTDSGRHTSITNILNAINKMENKYD